MRRRALRRAWPEVVAIVLVGMLASCAARTNDAGQIDASRDTQVAVLVAALEHSFAVNDYSSEEFAEQVPGEPPVAAYVVDAEALFDDVVRALQDRQVPVRVALDHHVNDGRHVIDQRTGERVISWAASVLEIRGDRARVDLSVVAGGRAASGFELILRRTRGKWEVERLNPTWIG